MSPAIIRFLLFRSDQFAMAADRDVLRRALHPQDGGLPCEDAGSRDRSFTGDDRRRLRKVTGRSGAPVKRKIAIGSKVRITAGPFSGMSGLYAGQSTRDREKILLSLLGGQRPVLIAADLVAPA